MMLIYHYSVELPAPNTTSHSTPGKKNASTTIISFGCVFRELFPLVNEWYIIHVGNFLSFVFVQLHRFPQVIRKSDNAGISDIRQLSASELRQEEPRLEPGACGALYISGEAVTDPWLLPVLLANDARKKGSVFFRLPLSYLFFDFYKRKRY